MTDQTRGFSRLGILKAVAMALLVYLAFGAFVLSFVPSPANRPLVEYFYLWDAEIFRSIAEYGYRFDQELFYTARSWETNNVAYPPLYPLLTSAARAAFDLPWIESMLLVSHLATLVTLILLILIARRLGATGIWTALVLLVIVLYPGSIWLLTAYSDALSLALAFAILHAAMGVLERPTRGRALVLLTLGLLLGLTHFRTSVLTAGGVMLGLTWWMRGSLDDRTPLERFRIGVWLCLPVLGAALAMLGFFAFCHIRFGHWDAYQQTIFGVWGVSTADFLQVFDPSIYSWFEVSLGQDRFGQSTPYLGRFLATWFLTLSLVFLVFEIVFGTTHTGRERRVNCSPGTWALLLSMVMQYFLITLRVPSLSNFMDYPMPSVRYLIPCAVLLGLYVAQLIPEIQRRHQGPQDAYTGIGYTLCAWLLLTGLILQSRMLDLFYQRILQG